MPLRARGRPRHDDRLTPAEWRIANAVRHGLSNRRIAERQGKSPDAVKFHIRNILGKLGLPDRRALRAWRGAPKDSPAAMEDEMKPEAQIALGDIGQLARSVKDIPAAVAWYRDVLGLKHLYTFGELAFFQCGSVRLMLSAAKEDKGDNLSVIYFRVPDIHAAHLELESRGAVFLGAPHLIHRHADGMEEWMAFFNDMDGNVLALMSQLRKSG
jgi:DNA-binding CsgD family transcriptional regulator/catechol 2,3-dioxygenase-like lactoylglutathione lyase family enzyme